MLRGGKFENGAITGAFGYLFNAATGRLIGGYSLASVVGAFGLELGPLDAPVIMGARWVGGIIGSAIEDWLVSPSVPNPNGRNGGEDHQAEVDRVEADMQSRGLDTQREYHVPTPDGEKSCRFCDVVGKDPATQKVEEMAQIGRENLDGTPVAREVRGLNDIQSATGMRPTFYPYNR
jgi:hypothetical protein